MGRPVVLENIYFFSFTPNQWLFPRVPSRQEGRIAIVTNARRDVVDAAASARKVDAGRGKLVSGSRRAGRTALMRTAKPCGSGTRGWCQAAGGACDPTGSVEPSSRQRWEARGIRLQGELGISRQTIAQGMPECSDCTCMLVCASHYIMHTRPRVQRAPGIPCSLLFEGQDFKQNLGRFASRDREDMPDARRHARC